MHLSIVWAGNVSFTLIHHSLNISEEYHTLETEIDSYYCGVCANVCDPMYSNFSRTASSKYTSS